MRPLLFLLFFFFFGCAYSVHMTHVSDFSPTYKAQNKGTLVSAHAEQFVVLGFTDNTHYVNQAYEGLLKSCVGGSIQGITSQYLTSLGFFSWTNEIDMQGLCVR